MKKLVAVLLLAIGSLAFTGTNNPETKKDSNVKILNTDSFDKYISKGVVVVDFWATWCAPCRVQGPILDDLSKEMKKVKFGKLDVDKNRQIAMRYGIRAIPTLIIFKDGKVAQKVVGLHQKEDLKKIISEHLK
jgi:thioredoxin 1